MKLEVLEIFVTTEFFSNTNTKWQVIVAFMNSSCVLWTENVWCVFRLKPSFSNSSGVVWTGLKFDVVVLLSSRKSISWALQLMLSASTPCADNLYEYVCVRPRSKRTSCGYFQGILWKDWQRPTILSSQDVTMATIKFSILAFIWPLLGRPSTFLTNF